MKIEGGGKSTRATRLARPALAKSLRGWAILPNPFATARGHAARARWLTPAEVTQRGFAYDKTGNRTGMTDALGVATPYAYPANSHRLNSVGAQARTYDAVGNPLSIGAVQLRYDERSRLDQVSLPIAQGEPPSPVWAYQYNGQGWRVAKTAAGTSTHFVYNENAQLVGEYDHAGNATQEFIWLGNLPIGVIASQAGVPVLHYIESDHLGTPRVIVDAARNVGIWRWNQTDDPFGERAPNADPDGDTNTFTFNLRFAGQYRDAETGWHYNVHRYYDPSVGRYLESDPVGLFGGILTYAYVGGSPLMYYDPLGLWAFGDPLPSWMVDGAAGFGDTLSFGLTNVIRDQAGWNGVVNRCSSAYTYGEWGGMGLSVAFGGAHIGRGLANQGWKLSRIYRDPRRWSSAQRTWSRSVGGYKGKYELHHWFTPQSAGGSNAIWNYMPVSPRLNRAMSNGGWLYGGFKRSVLSIYGAVPTAAYSNITSECDCG